ncbi:MAG: hypothetical protein ACMXYK_04860 [Candidatus Woesearchaeota archaeon]
MALEKEDYHAKVFTGTEYKGLDTAQTIGELRGMLEEMLEDLPKDPSLEIGELHCKGGTLRYILKEGFVQE